MCVFLTDIHAQKATQFSQYMEYKSVLNPADVASDEMMSVSGAYRLQWAGFKNAPKNLFLSMEYPVRIGDKKCGVGLFFSSDDVGLFKNQSVLLQYSYRFRLLGGELGLGVDVGFVNQKFDKESVDLTGDGELMSGDEYHAEQDPFIDGFTADEYSDVAFDVAFGAMYRNENYYIGVSAFHLTSPTVEISSSENYCMYLPRTFLLTGGYEFQTHNPLWTVTPSSLIKTDFSTWQVDVSGVFEYSKKVRTGMSYRFADAFVFLFGIDVIQGLKFGYSYDLPATKMIRSGGSHEVYLRYSFKPQFVKKNKYKSERIL